MKWFVAGEEESKDQGQCQKCEIFIFPSMPVGHIKSIAKLTVYMSILEPIHPYVDLK